MGHNHYVYGNKKEIEEYKAIRDKNEPLRTITILDPDAPRSEAKIDGGEPELSGSDYILETPLHDTGSIWYTILSFFLPIPGLIAGLIFKKKKFFRNFKACRKGALIGLGIVGALILLFLILLLFAAF